MSVHIHVAALILLLSPFVAFLQILSGLSLHYVTNFCCQCRAHIVILKDLTHTFDILKEFEQHK